MARRGPGPKCPWAKLFLSVIESKIQAFIQGFSSNAVVVQYVQLQIPFSYKCYPVCMGMSTTRYSTSAVTVVPSTQTP